MLRNKPLSLDFCEFLFKMFQMKMTLLQSKVTPTLKGFAYYTVVSSLAV